MNFDSAHWGLSWMAIIDHKLYEDVTVGREAQLRVSITRHETSSSSHSVKDRPFCANISFEGSCGFLSKRA